MKKFSLVLESKKRTFIVKATIELSISAENSGESGYIADSILSSINNIGKYSIEDIKENNSEK